MTDKIFKKPPVVKIICQFRFNLSEDNKWTDKRPGELLKALSGKYPNMEIPPNMGRIRVKEGSADPEIIHPEQRFVYSDEDRIRSVIVGPDSFSFVYTIGGEGAYKSWKKSFEPFVKDAWKEVSKCLNITEIKSIGVRYINHIDSKAYGLLPSETLSKNSEYLPKVIVSDCIGFFRSEIVADEKSTIVVQAGVLREEGGDDNKVVVLDIDKIAEHNISVSPKGLPKELATLQKGIEDVFFSSISDKLKEKMK